MSLDEAIAKQFFEGFFSEKMPGIPLQIEALFVRKKMKVSLYIPKNVEIGFYQKLKKEEGVLHEELKRLGYDRKWILTVFTTN